MIKVVLASSNSGKLAEFNSTLSAFNIDLIPQGAFDVEDAVEDGLSFIENAIKKARHAAAATGMPALADDSGIAVDALGGAPGIYSARYADNQGDAANNAKLLSELTGITARSARFHCCLALVRHAADPTPVICNASWEGHISNEAYGGGGFGYDPLFIPRGFDQSAAQLERSVKQTFSHRARALAQLKSFLMDNPSWLNK